MLKTLSMNWQVTLAKFFTLIASAAMITAQTSSASCIWLSMEQPRIPKSLIKE